jgi:5-methylcytosine-specific restriction protein A
MPRNPKWTRDELILALDLYFRVNPLHTSENNPEIISLSKLLNKLQIHARDDVEENFCNSSGVYMKSCNFLSLDPGYDGVGLAAGSKLNKRYGINFLKTENILQR